MKKIHSLFLHLRPGHIFFFLNNHIVARVCARENRGGFIAQNMRAVRHMWALHYFTLDLH